MANDQPIPTIAKYQLLKNRTVRFQCPGCSELLNTMLTDASKVDSCPSCAVKFRSPGTRELQLLRQQSKKVPAATVAAGPADEPPQKPALPVSTISPPPVSTTEQSEEAWNSLLTASESTYSTAGLESAGPPRVEAPAAIPSDASFLDDLPLPSMEQVPRTTFSQKTTRLGPELLSALVPRGSVPQDLREIISPNDPIYFADHPSSTVLYIRLAFSVLCFLPANAVVLFLAIVGDLAPFPSILLLGLSAIVNAYLCYVLYLGWKHTFYLVSSSHTACRSGIFNRKIRLAPIDRIQEIYIDSGIVDRWLDLNTVHLVTAASHGWLTGGLTFKSVDSKQVLNAINKGSQ